MQENILKPRKFKHVSWTPQFNKGFNLYVEYYSDSKIFFSKEWVDFHKKNKNHNYAEDAKKNIANGSFLWKSLKDIQDVVNRGCAYEIFDASEVYLYSIEDL